MKFVEKKKVCWNLKEESDQFIYLLKGDNITILPTVCEWLMKINDVYKDKGY